MRTLRLFVALVVATPISYAATPAEPEVPYIPTPEIVVHEMLRLAEVGADDLLYDLGSGDGRIVILAAKERGARGIGVEIDSALVVASRESARRAGVGNKVQFVERDLFTMDLRPATAVTLYLLPALNLRLRPKLLDELTPGTPVVSHQFDMGDWEPDDLVDVGDSVVYLWRIPAKVAGKWSYQTPRVNGAEHHELHIERQHFQKISGSVTVAGRRFPIRDGYVDGYKVHFVIERSIGGETTPQRIAARLDNGRLIDVKVTN